VALPELDYDAIRAALTDNAVKMGLQPLPTFLDKAIQLYEMIIVRHGLMLVRGLRLLRGCVWVWVWG